MLKANEDFYFGEFPQSLVNNLELLQKLNEKKPDKSGYVTIGNSKYLLVLASPKLFTLNLKPTEPKFSTGEIIKLNCKYWFKVEPIKWLVINKTADVVEVISEKTLTNIFNKDLRGSLNHYLTLVSASKNNASNQILNRAIDEIYQNEYLTLKSFVEDKFFKITFNLEERQRIVPQKDGIDLLKFVNRKSLNQIQKHPPILTDFARAIGVGFREGKKSGWTNWWYAKGKGFSQKIDYISMFPSFLGSGYPFSVGTNNVGFRPIIEVTNNDEMRIKNQNLIEEKNLIQEKQNLLFKEILKSQNKVPKSVSFQQIKPESSPFNSGFIQYAFLILIITIPLAVIFGILRAMFEEIRFSKFKPKMDAIIIDNSETLKIISPNDSTDYISIPFKEIESFHASTKSMMQFDLFPGRFIFSRLTHGTLFIKSKTQKIRIKHIKSVEVITILLELLIKDTARVAKLLVLNNLEIQKLHQFFESASTIFNQNERDKIEKSLLNFLQ